MKVENKFNAWIKQHNWNLNNSKTLLAVSGGRDSMAMLFLFLQKSFPFEIAHVNFGLRGEESQKETDFLVKFCDEKNIKIHVLNADTKDYMKINNLGMQEAAREIRYNFFEDITQSEKIKYIATAHHADDMLENFFMRMSKGAGIQGLAGIPSQNKNIIRPILNLTREEISTFCNENKIAFFDDSSNLKNDYERNKIRNEFLPQLHHFFGEKSSHFYQSTFLLAEANEIYTSAIRKKIHKLYSKNNGVIEISTLLLKSQKPLKTIVYELFSLFHFESTQLPDLLNLIDANSGKKIINPFFIALKDRNKILIYENKETEENCIVVNNFDEKIEGENFILKIKKYNEKSSIDFENNILIDPTTLDFPLIIRPWRKGDYFYPKGLNKKKKVSDFFIDKKMNILQKSTIPILCTQEKIIWIMGNRMDERFVPKKPNKECLILEWKSKL